MVNELINLLRGVEVSSASSIHLHQHKMEQRTNDTHTTVATSYLCLSGIAGFGGMQFRMCGLGWRGRLE